MITSYIFAVRILYEPIFDKSVLEDSEHILNACVNSLLEKFGRYAYDYTLHAHIHLAEQVRLHGPLQSNSQFVFEGAIYNLKLLLHGTRGYLDQIVRDIEATKLFFFNMKSKEFSNEYLYKYCLSNCTRYPVSNIENSRLLEPFLSRSFTDLESSLVNLYFPFKIDNSKTHIFSEKLLFDKQVFYSSLYNRRGKGDQFGHEIQYGQILKFFESNNQLYCFIKRFKIEKKNLVTKQKYSYSGIFYGFVKKYFNNFFVCFKNSDTHFVIDV